MKVAVTYEKETGNVFQHFGKTQYFKIYQIEDGKIVSSEVIDNGGPNSFELWCGEKRWDEIQRATRRSG